jgi:hypothetical protein
MIASASTWVLMKATYLVIKDTFSLILEHWSNPIQLFKIGFNKIYTKSYNLLNYGGYFDRLITKIRGFFNRFRRN